MDAQQLQNRTKQLALRIIRLVEALPLSRVADVIGRQLLRSSTSIGANYRAACRARSTQDMIAKLKVVEEEADETIYWLELIVESRLIPAARVTDLLQEANEIVAITVASIRTLRAKLRGHNRQSSIEES